MKFSRLFHNPFLEPSVSHAELLACTTETKERLVANNPSGVWDGLIAAINGALAELSAASAANNTRLGRRKGAKMTKRRFRREMTGKLARIYGTVLGHYGAEAAELKQVFPNGRRQFQRTLDDLLRSRLASLVGALTPLAAEMGSPGATALGLAEELLTGWVQVYQESEATSGQKSAAERSQREARVRAGGQMHRALLTVTAHFVSEAAAQGKVISKKEAAHFTGMYFRQDLLKDRPRRKKDAES